MNTLVTLHAARTIDTPAASMSTYASPTTEPASDLSVWRTQMQPNTSGPTHTIDTDHVVVIIQGRLTALVGNAAVEANVGDCVVLPAGRVRQLSAGPDGVVTVTAAQPGSTASAGDADPVRVPWAN